MNTIRRPVALLEILLVFPAILFMAALFARSVQPVQFEPAHTAQQIVDWYAARPHVGLWLLLIALPLLVLGIGLATLVRAWRRDSEFRNGTSQAVALVRSHFPALATAIATAAACGILMIVALHLLTD
jgi:hypothetical protein